jgi:glutathione peroxidase
MVKTVFSVILLFAGTAAAFAECPDFLNIEVQKLRSADKINLCKEYGDRPILIVNTASHCGFTPQFKELEEIHQKYKGRGLVVLGFPSNSFKQEARNEDETAKICYINYGVKFQMFSPIAVRGDDAHPIFKELARQSGEPTWNFNKYILDKNGKVVKYFGSLVKPSSKEFHDVISQVL